MWGAPRRWRSTEGEQRLRAVSTNKGEEYSGVVSTAEGTVCTTEEEEQPDGRTA